MEQQPLVGQGFLVIEASRSHPDIPQSLGLLWTSDQPDSGTYFWQHTTLTRDRHTFPGGIRIRNTRRRAAAGPRLRPRLHCSQNRHNTANQHLSGHTSQARVATFNRLTPNDPYMGRTAPLTSKRCILYIYSTNIGTDYFKHALYSLFFSLQNAVCFIMLTCLVPVLFTFYIQGVLKFKKIIPAPKG